MLNCLHDRDGLNRHGFTLVELMISMTISLAVVGAATAAFSLTAKVLGRCENLSKQNQAVREAYLSCADDADFWWSADDPFDATKQPQRVIVGGTGDAGRGSPFAPIDLPDSYWNWNVSDPDTWQRTAGYRGYDGSSPIYDISLTGTIGDADPYRRWNHELTDRLFNTLGIYGMAEYVPPCWFWCYMVSPTRTNSFGDAAAIWPSARPWQMGGLSRKFAMACRPLGTVPTGEPWSINGSRWPTVKHGFVSVMPRQEWACTSPTSDLIGLASRTVINDRDRAGAPIPNWSATTLQTTAISPRLRLRPTGWPVVKGGLMRHENSSGRMPVIDISTVDDVSGERLGYNFTVMATSLRGARQQRDWPHWNPGPVRSDR